MKASIPLLAACAGLSLASPAGGRARPGNNVNIEDISRQLAKNVEGALSKVRESEYWRKKDAMFKKAMAEDDYRWWLAFQMEPVVEEIDCDRSRYDFQETYQPDCEDKCREHFINKVRYLGLIQINDPDLYGVWSYHLPPGACLPRRMCWLKRDWDRREDVLVYKTGAKRALILPWGGILGDLELIPGGFYVKGMRQQCV
ncbi:hypothetical protein CDD83_714 [Cordyceps sp. RAO-2017]|nr:hypothetical protein CDD83_714 [Cordyceps sp. RAO-2017]